MFKKYFRSRTTTKLGLISRINCSSISRNICESTFRLGQLKKLQLLFVYYTTFTLTQNVWKSPKMSHLNFRILSFSTNFCPIKIDLSGNTVWPQASGFQKLVNLTIFGIFNELLSTQNVNHARLVCNVECDFLGDFQTLCNRRSHFFLKFENFLNEGENRRGNHSVVQFVGLKLGWTLMEKVCLSISKKINVDSRENPFPEWASAIKN